MLSTQMSERDSHVDKATLEPQMDLASRPPSPEGPKGSAARKWIVLLVILAVVGAAVWKIRRNTKEQDSVQMIMAAQADRPTPVQVSAVQQKTMPIFLTALGTVTAYNTVTIKSRVDGQLMQVPVSEGQAVHGVLGEGLLAGEFGTAHGAPAERIVARDPVQRAGIVPQDGIAH